MKTCPCCQLVYSRDAWEALPTVGVTLTYDEQGEYRLEMKNCACGSTIAIETHAPMAATVSL